MYCKSCNCANQVSDVSTPTLIESIDSWNRGEVWAHDQDTINAIIAELMRRFPVDAGEHDG